MSTNTQSSSSSPPPPPIKEERTVVITETAATTNSNPNQVQVQVQVQKEKEKPKIERTIIVPPCPQSVATAYLIIRAAINGVLGISLSSLDSSNNIEISLLQSLYIKEKKPTGKFVISISNNTNSTCVPIPTTLVDDDTCTRSYQLILDTIETVVNQIVQDNLPITNIIGLNKQTIIDYCTTEQLHVSNIFWNGYEKSLSTTKDKSINETSKDNLVLSYIQDTIIAVPQGSYGTTIPYMSTGYNIQRIEFEKHTTNPGYTSISVGKKGKKIDITIKFNVIEKNNTSISTNVQVTSNSSSLISDISKVSLSSLLEQKIRYDQGKVLLQQITELINTSNNKIKEAEKVAIAAAAAAENTIATTTTDTQIATDSTNDNTSTTTTTTTTTDSNKMIVTVEEVKGDIDYDLLVKDFGSTLIDDILLQKIIKCTVGSGRVSTLHRFLRRNIFFSHRDLHTLIDCHMLSSSSNGNNTVAPFYLYTGRGPSSSAMHLGHLIPFLFTKWLQDAFNVPLVIQMTDDEKFLFKGSYDNETGDNLTTYTNYTIENIKDIIACGFNYNKTFIFSNIQYVGTMYPNIVRIWKAVTTNTVNNIFGFTPSCNIGKIAFPAIQAAPAFASSFPIVLDKQQDNNKDDDDNTTKDNTKQQQHKINEYLCLIPCAIDQDPYFRLTRDVAHKLVPKTHKLNGKPSLIHSKFFPSLQGSNGKMSSSDNSTAIFLTDTQEEIAYKIKNHAFSGGQATAELQKLHGANIDIDVSYQWLKFFLEDDDELELIGQSYKSGTGPYWSTNAVKTKLISVLQELVFNHQKIRSQITDDDVRKWMIERSIV